MNDFMVLISPNNMQMVIEYGWTLASLFAVLLSLWALPRAFRVYRDVMADAQAMRRAGEVDGRRSFSEQQCREGRLLYIAHWFALFHQSLFFAVGIYALSEPNVSIEPGAPFLEEFGAPITLLVAQYLIVTLQVALVRVTSEQKRWRENSLKQDN